MGFELSKSNDCLTKVAVFFFGFRDPISYLNLVPHSSLTAWRCGTLIFFKEPSEKKNV